MSERLAALARRVENDPFYLASALLVYARVEALDDAQLAARLGCSTDQLSAIRLCRMPRGNPIEFRRDVDRIASAFGLDAAALAAAVRLAASLQALGQFQQDSGLLMAARDRELREPDEPRYDEDSQPDEDAEP